MIETTKKVIKVERRTEPFKCKICKKMVRVNYATPKITETEDTILYGWDYKHSHKNIFQVQKIDGQDTYLPISADEFEV